MEQEQSCIQVDLKAETEKPDEVFIEIELPFILYQYLSSENCDVQKICRICLAVDSKEMFPLGTEKENNMLAQMLTAVCCIQIDETDGLPSQICANCQTLTVQSYEFKAQSERADHILRSILKGEFLIKQEAVLQDSRSFVKDDKPDDVDVKPEAEITDELPTHLIYEKYTENKKSTNKEEILYVINNNSKENNNIDVSVTDSKTLLKEIITKKGINRKKRRKVYKCSSCPKNFVKLGLLKEHRKLEHNTDTQLLSCDYCKDSFNSEHDLNLHLSLHKIGPAWKCIQCHKEFNGKNELSRHIKRHMETKKYSCGNCEKSFAELYALRRHARVHTGESLEKKHACHLCDKRYSESNALANHLKRHSGLRPCVCATCGKSFPSQRLLHSHALVHSDNKPYGCNYCDKRFRHESTRNTHQRLHTGEKPYVCSACGKTFVQASNLTLHMRTHTGERPYSCTVCSRKFTSGSSLKTHLRIHTGERPFTCNVCGKSFARQNLRAHMRQHSGERPFECSVCAKKFINAARLREHVRTHTGEKPFECASCPRKFPTKTHLTTHMKAHEKKKKAERRIIIHPKKQTSENVLKPSDEVSEEINKELFIDDQNIETNVVLVSSDNTLTNAEIPIIDKELVIDDNNSIETNILVVDHNDKNTVHILENDINYTVNEGVVSIASGVLEGTTVKLHQLDQSLVQIHSSGGQVTISKITSKMTANF